MSVGIHGHVDIDLDGRETWAANSDKTPIFFVGTVVGITPRLHHDHRAWDRQRQEERVCAKRKRQDKRSKTQERRSKKQEKKQQAREEPMSVPPPPPPVLCTVFSPS
jgi:hypothetical protein